MTPGLALTLFSPSGENAAYGTDGRRLCFIRYLMYNRYIVWLLDLFILLLMSWQHGMATVVFVFLLVCDRSRSAFALCQNWQENALELQNALGWDSFRKCLMAIYWTLASWDILSTNLKRTVHTNTGDVCVLSEFPTVPSHWLLGSLCFYKMLHCSIPESSN